VAVGEDEVSFSGVGDIEEGGGAVRFVLWRMKDANCHRCWRERWIPEKGEYRRCGWNGRNAASLGGKNVRGNEFWPALISCGDRIEARMMMNCVVEEME
jgi:hypothetical protein